MIIRFFLSYDICLSIHLMLHLHVYSVYASSKGSGEYANSSDQPEPWLLANVIRPNKKISVFQVMGLKILGRVGTHIFFLEKI